MRNWRSGKARRKSRRPKDGEEFAKGGDVTINPPSYWVEHGKPERQASLVVDPPNGRIPPLTPEGQAAVKALRGGLGPGSHFPDKVDSWEDFDIYSRCITRGMVSSMLPTLYNFGNEILQAPGYVMIRNEMIHETRVIPLDGRPHVGKGIADLHGRFARALGRQHAGGGDHQPEATSPAWAADCSPMPRC